MAFRVSTRKVPRVDDTSMGLILNAGLALYEGFSSATGSGTGVEGAVSSFKKNCAGLFEN